MALVTILVALQSCNKNPAQPSEGTRSRPDESGPAGLDVPIDGPLAFVSTRDGALHIYVADESRVTRLAPGDRPAWSPDGSQIAFNGAAHDGIFVMNADGTGVRHLGRGHNPDWSPDGTRIVFDDEDGIFAMHADGSAVRKVIDRRLVRTPMGYECGLLTPAWSPDGRHIAFVCAEYDDVWQIHIANADGSSPRRLHNSPTFTFAHAEPTWSIDGLRIAFDSPDGVDVIDVDGSQLRTVIHDGFWADWSVDGRFAFTRITGPGPTAFDGAETRVFVATEGGAQRQLIPDAVNPALPRYGDFHPAWAH
jgi:dipeptidyl aminopeptidase/acylaminoacyl peptidase